MSLVLFATSCKKEATIPKSTNNELNQNEDIPLGTPECNFSLSLEQIDSIGSEHNRLVQIVFNDYLMNSELTIFDALNNAYEGNNYPTLSEEEFEEFEEKYAEENVQSTVEYIIDTMSNDTQKQIFTDMVNAVVENTYDYTRLLETLDSLKAYTNDHLTCYERLSTLAALEVCINSAKLWYSTEAGGEGYFDFISTGAYGRTSENHRTTGFWSSPASIVVGDAVGAFNGFCQGAMPYLLSGGAANPVSNAILAGHTIRGAVTGSVMAGVSQAVR